MGTYIEGHCFRNGKDIIIHHYDGRIIISENDSTPLVNDSILSILISPMDLRQSTQFRVIAKPNKLV